ncbi:hypothetical protein [Methylomagnum ishizawai]|uniref:hypothetical protein n=1 Tax=Methylomagnum ishizawai TaxID=1760988 RepID=UPI001C34183D|nr:hypothetical protein [Methylomagnum ishizawai]BBL73236.1 hypothetical protein MishRS11D_03340 [Methylomagnum ishizawai]
MRHETIDGQEVEICVISADGTEVEEALRPDERGLLGRIDAALKAHAGFCAAYPGARLVRVDSNRGLGDRDEGRSYLRYQHQGGITELWGNAADGVGVDLERGIVGA